MLRRLTLASVLFSTACATTGQGDKPATAAASVEQQMRITNQSPFDVAACQPRQMSLPQPANQGILVGALVSVRPQLMECLVDPKARGPEKTTRVVVKSTVTEQGGTHAISGENLTPEGQACLQKAVDSQVPLAALPAGSQPVESQAEFVHESGNSPTVTFGINEGSDFSGAVRLAQAQWCDCYAGFNNKAPPMLKSSIHLKKGVANATTITFDPVGTPEGDQLAACLQQKMAALPVTLQSSELKFPHRFIHFHSQATEASADLPPEFRFFQLELVRSQRAADSAIAFGARANAAEAYDAIVQKYQKTKDWKLADELTGKCKSLVDSAQKWVDTLNSQLQADQQSLANVQELKAKDAAWSDVETKAQEAITRTQQDLTAAQERLKADEAACPKVSYKK
jgi:hypothetical protein